MLVGAIAQYFFGITIFITSVFLILLVLVQRGRGGGLTGALGGPGGQSAFGTKAGDLFTRITIVVASIWILLCASAVYVLNPATDPDNLFNVGTTGTSGVMGSFESSPNAAPLGNPTDRGPAAPALPGDQTPAAPAAPAPGAAEVQTPADFPTDPQDGAAPAADAPTGNADLSDTPAAPATDAPATDAPATDAPATDAPATDAPSADAVDADAATATAPAGDAEPPATDPATLPQ
jgi:preprotein translocase subunit SecG